MIHCSNESRSLQQVIKKSGIMQKYQCKIMESDVDWASLPSDLLLLICQKLHLLSDFIRFRAVCKNWWVSANYTVSPPQIPWFVEFFQPNSAFIYSLSSYKKYNVYFTQKFQKKELIGPGKTYVLARDRTNKSLSLLNPLSGEEHPLPPLPVYIRSKEFYPLYLGQNQPKEGVILLAIGCNHRLVFCQKNGEKWSILDLQGKLFEQMPFACAYCNGMYFINWSKGGAPTHIINANTGHVMCVIKSPPDPAYCDYLVESFGDILRVQVNNNSDLSFRIYKLDYGGNDARWIEIGSIGDRIIFLGNFLIPYFYLYGFTLRDCNVTGLKGNCIYLPTLGIHDCGRICCYHIEDKRTEFLPYSEHAFHNWFIPSL